MQKTYIILDESGAMHLKDERYFIVAGFITQELHQVTSIHKKTEAIIKMAKGIDVKKKVEFKSSFINPSQQALFLNNLFSLKKIIPVAIVVDKYNLAKFGASENVAYNFFVKNLLKYLFKCNIDIMHNHSFELRVDNRNTSVKNLKDLETFLSWEFEIMNLDFQVKYLDSKDSRDIQMADYVANMLWKKYNRSKKDKLSPKLRPHKLILSKFPYKEFGHDPSLREINEKSCQTSNSSV